VRGPTYDAAVPVVQLVVDRAEAELAADALWQAGPSAVAEEELPDGRVRLTADVADALAVGGAWALTVIDPDHDAHLDAWRRWAQPVRVGRRIVLNPAWQPAVPGPAHDLVVVLDPGRTFGSGAHPSTQLAVAAIEAHLRPGDRMLDVGGGSGVLSVVAARLGAARVWAIDIDPRAPAVTAANALANGVQAVVVASDTPLAEVDGVFDMVTANIGVRVLTEVAGGLRDRLDTGGFLVLAGLLEAQVDPLLATAFPDLVEVERRRLQGWAASVLTR
jgi:ribosomal protein L11 methyltransferase